MRKPIVYICKGLPGAGKSFWSRKFIEDHFNSVKRVSKDDLRAMTDNGRHSSDAEKTICAARDVLILSHIARGKDVIVDDTNLAPHHEENIRKLVAGKAEVVIKDEFLSVSLEECIARDAKREKPVGEKNIREMADRWIKKPLQRVQKPQETGKVRCVISDLDGTMALITGRDPYDAAKCEKDELNEPVWYVFSHLSKFYTPILVSGRSEQFRPETERWLAANNVTYSDLHMRPVGDARKDTVVKEEIYRTKIEPFYDVFLVLDDRDSVVKTWRSLGIPTWQVNEGNF